ncbi:SpoIIE family protein phosphatase [Blastococcus sp. VKM Ac-2987]|uniref:SpoIIE family protein phosphatase n=1 Tax=Blastococcus sp. VKM Ac-2987 TaxID=3004141 RepID=UPI0022ABABD6|nr:SpoIIE family protein phosphatase [Blastococcus sp. VKM Ac-2987]MCZ2860455.1 SpoIIE family protein phosphatase [Blastococcus sp. VKM Ac-2987]
MPDFRRVFDVAPTPFLLLTPDLVIVHANQARLDATATTLAGTVGRYLFDVFPLNPDDPHADGPVNLRASLERARDTRQPHTMALQKYDIRLPDGSYDVRFWSPRNVPVLDDDGEVVLLLHRADDVTDYIRARAGVAAAAAEGRLDDRAMQVESDLLTRTRELEQSNAQLRALREREQRTARALAGLARTVSALAAAETRAELLRIMADLGGPGLSADFLAVALHRPGSSELTVVDAGGGTGPGARQLPGDAPSPLAVAAAGRRVLVADAGTSPAPPPGPGLRAWAALPLRSAERALGSLAVGWYRPQPLEDDDVRVLEAFAAQCGQALDRVARLEQERRQARATRSLAEALQRSMLTDPPRPEGLGIAVRYRPAAQEARVGGDWYDAFGTPDGATTLVVGDVTGHDRTAAALMGQLRNVLRGIAHALGSDPARVLSTLDRAMAGLGISTLASALVARIESPSGRAPGSERVLRWSNAGHPPPLLVGPDGTVELLERPHDVLLGVLPDARRSEHTLPLPPGATVVLYTDGLVERRGSTLDEGLHRLAAAAGDLPDLPVEAVADTLLARVAPDFSDDVALVVLRVLRDGSGTVRG